MAAFLVIGRAGSGKTAVAKELFRRGFAAFDADDVPRLSAWIDLATGERTTVHNAGIIDDTKVDWLWDEKILTEFLAKYDGRDIFLCGGAGNDLVLHTHFDKTFVLSVDPTIQAERLRTRTDNDYGKHPQMIPKVIAQQAELVRRGTAAGTVSIDADAPISEVVDAIVGAITWR